MDLLLRDEERRSKLEEDVGSSIVEQWELFIDESVEAEFSPSLIDYRDKGNADSNPYHLRYGAGWMSVIKKVSALSPYVCVTDYVQHIYDKSKTHFNAYFPELGEDWYFYHDALSQMTAKDCKHWMKEQGIWKHWLLPVDGDRDPYARSITGSFRDQYPPGNNPTLMPWDVALNQDLHDGVNRHCLLTSNLEEEDESKFSITTPKRGTSAYLRVLEGVPKPNRIARDMGMFVETLLVMYEHKGALVHGIGDRNYRSGHRAGAAALAYQGVKKENRGGKRKKRTNEELLATTDQWTHPDAIGQYTVKIERSLNAMSARLGDVFVHQEGDDEE